MAAYLPNLEPLIAAGINPKTGLPVKFGGDSGHLKEDVKKFLRLVDEQDAVNRYTWTIPEEIKISSQELERMLYYKGQLCFFYDEGTQQFYFSPYALDGTIDMYGRFNTVHPVPMACGTTDSKEGKAIAEYFAKKKLECVYAIPQEAIENANKVTVLLHDYSKQLSQTILPRVTVNDPLLDVMAECVPMARTSRLLSTGVKGIRVQDEDQAGNVQDANRSLEQASLTGKGFVPIVGSVEFQELCGSAPAKGEEYMLAMQSLDNLRLSGYGINNNGLFEKKAHELESEQAVNNSPSSLVMEDGLKIRQRFCDIVNSIWNLGLAVDINEKVNPEIQEVSMEETDSPELEKGENA